MTYNDLLRAATLCATGSIAEGTFRSLIRDFATHSIDNQFDLLLDRLVGPGQSPSEAQAPRPDRRPSPAVSRTCAYCHGPIVGPNRRRFCSDAHRAQYHTRLRSPYWSGPTIHAERVKGTSITDAQLLADLFPASRTPHHACRPHYDTIEGYTIDKHGLVASPGKFQGEPRWVPHFWALAKDPAEIYINADDLAKFHELQGMYIVRLVEDDQGFVRGELLPEPPPGG